MAPLLKCNDYTMEVEILAPPIIEPVGLPRSDGIHVSNIIRVIAVLNKSLKPQYVESLDLVDRSSENWWETLDEPVKIRMAIGMAWEEWYVRTQLPNVVGQPGEMCVEGIYMTHDGESLETIMSERGHDQTVLALHEVKTTSKSINTVGNLKSQYIWLSQMKAYCKGLGTIHANLHVLYLQGDYSYPRQQMLRVYRVTFTQAEIDENWQILTSFVRHKQAQLHEDMMRDTE